MIKQAIHMVWMKRDIRSKDHAPLFYAEQSGLPYVVIYFFEPLFDSKKDVALRQQKFIYEGIQSINNNQTHKLQIEVLYTDLLPFFKLDFRKLRFKTHLELSRKRYGRLVE